MLHSQLHCLAQWLAAESSAWGGGGGGTSMDLVKLAVYTGISHS